MSGPQGPGTSGQGSALAALLAARVGAQHGLPPANRPFAAVPGTQKNAASLKVPNLDARLALAKAQRQRLTHGGLGGDPGESAAIKTIVRSAPAAPPPTKLAAPPRSAPVVGPQATAVSRGTQPAVGARGGAPHNPFLAPVTPGPNFSHLLDPSLLSHLPQGVQEGVKDVATPPAPIRDFFGSGLKALGTVAQGINYGVGTTAAVGLAGLTNDKKTLGGSALDAKSYVSAPEAAARISNVGTKLPQFVPHGDLVGSAYGASKNVTPQELVAAGLSKEQTKFFRDMAINKHHWYPGEINNLAGLDLVAHAYSDAPALPWRIAINAAAGLTRAASVPVALVAGAQQTLAGHPEKFAQGLGNAVGTQLGDLAHNPWQALVSDPAVVIPEVGGALKLAGMAGHLSRGEALAREVVPAGSATGKAVRVGSGKYDKNLYVQGLQQRPFDWLAAHNTHVGDILLQRQADLHVHHAANETQAVGHSLRREEAIARAGNLVGKGGVKNERAVLIQEAQRYGGIHADGSVDLPALQKAQAAWEHVVERDGPQSPAAAQVRLIRDRIIPGLIDKHALPTRPSEGGLFPPPVVAQRNLGEPHLQSEFPPPVEPHPSGIEPRGVPFGHPANRLSEADVRYAQAHADLAAHTSDVAGAGPGTGFGESAALYRRYEQMLSHDAPLVSTAKGTQAIRHGDPLAIEVFKTRALWDKRAKAPDVIPGNHLPEDAVILKQNYDNALHAYVDRHLNAGGAEPVRSQYILGDLPSNFVASKLGFNRGPQRVYASSGRSADTGSYTHDVMSAQRESLRADKIALNAKAAENVLQKSGRLETNGDYILQPGEAFVSMTNATSLAKTLRDLSAQTHPSEHAAENALLNKFNELMGGAPGATAQTGRRIGEAGYVLPQATLERLKQYTQPVSFNLYQRALNQYQKLLIGTGPGTLLGNTLGTVPLGLIGGAGPLDYLAVLRHTINHPERVPYTMHNAGVSGAFAEDSRGPLGKLNPMRAVNTAIRASRSGEDVTREALWISKMGGWKEMTARAKELGYIDEKGLGDVRQYAMDVSAGRGAAKADIHLRDEAARHTIKFVGDNLAPTGRLGKTAGQVILFHKWVEHVGKFMLYTLPVHHPLRMELINVLGQYGDSYRREHGVWPSWMGDFAPLFPEMIAGQAFTRAVNLNQFSPQGVAGNLLGNLTSDQPWANKAASVVNPLIGAPLNVLAQDIQNRMNRTPASLPWMIAASAARAIPHEANVFPSTQRPPDWVPFLHDNGFRPHKTLDLVTGKYEALPDKYRPGARPYGQDGSFMQALLGGFERYFGVGQYSVPNTPNDVQIEAAITRGDKSIGSNPLLRGRP